MFHEREMFYFNIMLRNDDDGILMSSKARETLWDPKRTLDKNIFTPII